jgi:oxygen-dependent protoporphyrinogen oxidase
MEASSPPPPPRRIAVIGGGIAGLAAAHRLVEIDPAASVTLFEAGPRVGGILRTERVDDFLVEHSADSFITNTPWAIDLCRRVGLEDELLPTDRRRRGALIARGSRLMRVPEGFMLMQPRRMWPLVTSPLLSVPGKLRLLAECLVPRRRETADESLAAFARRRLGREAFERLVQPLVGGIYTADAEQLSLAATMPRFLEMERRHGGLIRAAWASPGNGDTTRGRTSPDDNADDTSSGARYGLFAAPRRGMSSLVEAIAARLPPDTIRLNTPIDRIAPTPDGRWQVTSNAIEGGLPSAAPHSALRAPNSELSFDALILALPAHRAAPLVAGFDNALATELSGIEYASSVVIAAGYRRDQIAHPLDAFGFVVPDVENRRVLSCSFSSLKFPGRCRDDQVLLRTFLGGARRPEMVDLPDDELLTIVAEELGEWLGLRGDPLMYRILRWRRAMPQYHLGHLDRVARIEALAAAHGGLAQPALALCGNAFRGVGIPDCIRGGEQAAEQLRLRSC